MSRGHMKGATRGRKTNDWLRFHNMRKSKARVSQTSKPIACPFNASHRRVGLNAFLEHIQSCRG
jgi:hypothetical protein